MYTAALRQLVQHPAPLTGPQSSPHTGAPGQCGRVHGCNGDFDWYNFDSDFNFDYVLCISDSNFDLCISDFDFDFDLRLRGCLGRTDPTRRALTAVLSRTTDPSPPLQPAQP